MPSHSTIDYGPTFAPLRAEKGISSSLALKIGKFLFGTGLVVLSVYGLSKELESATKPAPQLAAYYQSSPVQENQTAWPLINQIADKAHEDPQQVEYELDRTQGNNGDVGKLAVGQPIYIPEEFKADVDSKEYTQVTLPSNK